MVLGINTTRVLSFDTERPYWLYPEGPRHYAPASSHLEEVTRRHLEDLVSGDDRFVDAFDRFEALVGLVHVHLTSGGVLADPNPGYGPVWQFAYRNRYLLRRDLIGQLAEELHSEGDRWPPVAAGLFGAAHAYDMADQACRRYQTLVAGMARN